MTRTLGVALALAVAAYAWWVVGLPAFSAVATVAVLAPGGLAMVLGGRCLPFGGSARAQRRFRCQPAQAGRGLAVWAALAVVAVGWELAAYLQHPRADHPTLSSLTNSVLDGHALRAAAFIGWLAVAARLGRR